MRNNLFGSLFPKPQRKEPLPGEFILPDMAIGWGGGWGGEAGGRAIMDHCRTKCARNPDGVQKGVK